jgi:sigma-B regulation protein RsbU (phosphoserine phosphatase)
VLEEVLALVVDAALVATGAERGFIMLGDADGRLEMKLARGIGGVTLADGEYRVSSKVPDEVFATGRTSVVADLLEGDLAAQHVGTVALGIRQVLCAPLRLVRYRGQGDAPPAPRNIGVLYMDSRERGLLSAPVRMALEALASQAAIAIENARLYQEEIEKARVDEELKTASQIQQALLPEGRRAGDFFQVVGASTPSRAIGGDFFDYQDLAGAGFSVSLGDVTGKGPAAALLAALVQGVLAARVAISGPEEVVAVINRVLLARPIESRFVTLFLAVLAPDGELTYCNAAQNPPLVFAGADVVRLDVGGTLVGAFPSTVYERGRARLRSGDTLVIFSDGLAEAEDPEGREFGEDGIIHAVSSVRDASIDVVLQTLFQAVRTFTQGAPPRDDLTAVVLRYTK